MQKISAKEVEKKLSSLCDQLIELEDGLANATGSGQRRRETIQNIRYELSRVAKDAGLLRDRE